MLDQSVGAEAPQRLAHRAATNRKAGGEVAFDQPRSWLKPPCKNVLAQLFDDEGDGRAMGRRDRGRPRKRTRIVSGGGV